MSKAMVSTPTEPEYRIVEDDLDGSEIQELLRLHAEGMLSNSPEGACHFLERAGLKGPHITVWSIWSLDGLAGCGALREIDRHHGEVKSMRTAPDHLGSGVGRTLLTHIVRTAKERSYERLSLETGSGDAFAAAVHVYEKFGFEQCEAFDGYADNEFSQFFTLSLL